MAVIFSNKSKEMIFGFREHSHPYGEIIVTTQGEGTTIIGEKKFEVKKGSVLLIPPQIKHLHESIHGFSDISIQVDEFNDELASGTPVLFFDNTDALITLADMIYYNYIEKEFNYKAINQKLLDLMYEYLIRIQGTKHTYDFVWKLKDAMTANLSNSAFDISKEAKTLGVSFDYMRHCFKEELQQTPLAYLTGICIRQAKRLLEHNRVCKIAEIANMCGYADQYYFSKMFKKLVGISPKEYRLKKRQEAE